MKDEQRIVEGDENMGFGMAAEGDMSAGKKMGMAL